MPDLRTYQVEALRAALGGLSRGQASDLIDAAFAAQRLEQTGVVA